MKNKNKHAYRLGYKDPQFKEWGESGFFQNSNIDIYIQYKAENIFHKHYDYLTMNKNRSKKILKNIYNGIYKRLKGKLPTLN